MEPPEVRRFLRQEFLKKVGHSWWNRPRVYRHDLANEREPTPVCSGYTLRPGTARSVAGAAGVGPHRVQRSDDTGWASRVPGHVVTPHSRPGHLSRRRYRGVPVDKGGMSGGRNVKTGDGPA